MARIMRSLAPLTTTLVVLTGAKSAANDLVPSATRMAPRRRATISKGTRAR